MQISHESIYSYLYVLPRGTLRKELVKCLRRNHINRRPRGGKSRRNCASIQDYLSIEERPALSSRPNYSWPLGRRSSHGA